MEEAEIQTLGEGEGLSSHGQTVPEASHESQARAKIGARAGERATDGAKGDPARSPERRARGRGQDGQVKERPTSKAAANERGVKKQSGQMRLDGRRHGVEETGNMGRPTRPRTLPPRHIPPNHTKPNPDYEVENGRTCEAT